jgi:hypothetical protein
VDLGWGLLRKTSKRPTAGVFAGVGAGGVCFSSECSLRGTNSSAPPSAPQRRAPSKFGVVPLH